ncbi:MAG: isopentenyl-diphosphate delta-isomerase [Bacteroidetes bacterium]|jgi:isopentenyl-diphosphate delta-isomerase|nr:isopentenyl-diphosphate delta-isomerase [Bacteroidota bacterium]
MNEESVILVDANDNEIGTAEKLHAHTTGQLHRAISVFIFNSEKKMLLQQRDYDKYHSAGLWSNACCSHPRPGENTKDAARRRLKEEMGIDVSDLQFAFHFTYRAELENDLTEHEFDHVFIGKSDAVPVKNPDEVVDFNYFTIEEIESDLHNYPEHFTYWFRLIFERVKTEAQKFRIL